MDFDSGYSSSENSLDSPVRHRTYAAVPAPKEDIYDFFTHPSPVCEFQPNVVDPPSNTRVSLAQISLPLSPSSSSNQASSSSISRNGLNLAMLRGIHSFGGLGAHGINNLRGGSSSTSTSSLNFDSFARTHLPFKVHNFDEEFDLIGPLGAGSFGRVLLAKHLSSQKMYAVKRINIAKCAKGKQVKRVMNEKECMLSIVSPFVVMCYSTFKNEKNLYFILEYLPGGDLYTLMRSRHGVPANTVPFYVAELTEGLKAIHAANIVYRDLKPENILLDSRGHIRLGDFGFAQKRMEKTYSLCGTPEYMAPEMVLGKGSGKAVDWWALGIVIYELITRRPPFTQKDKMALYAAIVGGQVNYPLDFPRNALDLCSQLLLKDDAIRLGSGKDGARDVQNHPYFESINWSALSSQTCTTPWKPELLSPYDTSCFDFDSQNFDDPELETPESLGPEFEPYKQMLCDF